MVGSTELRPWLQDGDVVALRLGTSHNALPGLMEALGNKKPHNLS